MRSRFRRVAGVDFSGARQAGTKIWVSDGHVEGRKLFVRRLVRADALSGGARDRQAALSALGTFVASDPDLIVGCDFPFSLPKRLLQGRSWQDWLVGLMAGYADAEGFRDACRALAGRKEWRRATDHEAKTPFCPYNLRLYRQTYWGTKGLLAPLVASDRAVVLPMMADEPGKPAIIETCPASVLKRWYGPRGNVGYKEPGAKCAARREEIVVCLKNEGVDINASDARKAVETANGDPLDALLAAYATWNASRDLGNLQPRAGSDDALEARVFF